MVFSWNLQSLFLAGYVLCFIGLNSITYGISSFYRKKFSQRSARIGFLIAIVSFVLFFPCLFLTGPGAGPCKIIQTILLLCGSSASAWNSIVLFMTMKRVRK